MDIMDWMLMDNNSTEHVIFQAESKELTYIVTSPWDGRN